MSRNLAILAPILALAALSGCAKTLEAPGDRGVCWHMARTQDGKARFNRLAEKVDTVEKCAAELEGMRLRFLSLGGSNADIIGAYQGQFLILQQEGIFMAPSLTGGRYLLLVRTGDGRLAKPGVLPVD